MQKRTVKQWQADFEKQRKAAAATRDALRKLLEEVDDLESDIASATQALDEASELISQAVETISQTV